jgi:hypothetical protein
MKDDVQCGTVLELAGTVVIEDSVVNCGVPILSDCELDCATETVGAIRMTNSRQTNAVKFFKESLLLSLVGLGY